MGEPVEDARAALVVQLREYATLMSKSLLSSRRKQGAVASAFALWFEHWNDPDVEVPLPPEPAQVDVVPLPPVVVPYAPGDLTHRPPPPSRDLLPPLLSPVNAAATAVATLPLTGAAAGSQMFSGAQIQLQAPPGSPLAFREDGQYEVVSMWGRAGERVSVDFTLDAVPDGWGVEFVFGYRSAAALTSRRLVDVHQILGQIGGGLTFVGRASAIVDFAPTVVTGARPDDWDNARFEDAGILIPGPFAAGSYRLELIVPRGDAGFVELLDIVVQPPKPLPAARIA